MIKLIKSTFFAAPLLGLSANAYAASPGTNTNMQYQLGVYASYTQLHDDHYADILNNAERFNKSKGYGINAGAKWSNLLQFGIELAKHEDFSAKSKNYLAELNLAQSMTSLYAKQSFYWRQNLNWYLKESIYFASVKQQEQNTAGKSESLLEDDLIFPALALGLEKHFTDKGYQFSWYAQFKYASYQIENSSDKYKLGFSSFSTGINYVF